MIKFKIGYITLFQIVVNIRIYCSNMRTTLVTSFPNEKVMVEIDVIANVH